MFTKPVFHFSNFSRLMAVSFLIACLWAIGACGGPSDSSPRGTDSAQQANNNQDATTAVGANAFSETPKLRVLYITEARLRSLIPLSGNISGKKLSLQFQIISLDPVEFTLMCFPFSTPNYDTSRKIVLDTLPGTILTLPLGSSDILSTQKLSNVRFQPFRSMLSNSVPNEVILFVPNRNSTGYLYYDVLIRPSINVFSQEVAGKSRPLEFLDALRTNPSPPAKDDPNSDD